MSQEEAPLRPAWVPGDDKNSVPVRQWNDPDKCRFVLVPGVTTSPGGPGTSASARSWDWYGPRPRLAVVKQSGPTWVTSA